MAQGEPCRRRHASCLSDFGRNLIRSQKAVKLKMNAVLRYRQITLATVLLPRRHQLVSLPLEH